MAVRAKRPPMGDGAGREVVSALLRQAGGLVVAGHLEAGDVVLRDGVRAAIRRRWCSLAASVVLLGVREPGGEEPGGLRGGAGIATLGAGLSCATRVRGGACRARRKRGDGQCGEGGQNQFAHDHCFYWGRLRGRHPPSVQASATGPLVLPEHPWGKRGDSEQEGGSGWKTPRLRNRRMPACGTSDAPVGRFSPERAGGPSYAGPPHR